MTRSFRGVRLIRFGEFVLDVRAGELRKSGVRVRLQEQPFRILMMLLERPGEVVLRDELRKRLWPNGTIVEVGHGINAAVLRLREALGESAESPTFIQTLTRRGYRFAGHLTVEYKERSGPAAVSAVPGEAGDPGAGADLPDTSNLAGQTILHYQVLEKLGSGGMGVVYRADDLRLGRQVALKFLPQEMAGDRIALGRFQREARAASALNHPNICIVYGVEEYLGLPFIVMERLEGETLEARLVHGAIPLPKALALAVQMADALDAAHRKGIVHRDLKPANVWLTKSGVKVLDFGLAKMERAVSPGSEAGSVTREGAILGTLHYMSPEQVQGKAADTCSDIFSFGLVFYEMLAGRRAFPGENSASVMAAILTADAPRLRDPLLPGLDPILKRCLAKDPEDRWQSVRDLKAAVEWVAAGWNPATTAAPPAPSKRFSRAAIAAGVLMLSGGLALMQYRWQENRGVGPQQQARPATPLASTTLPSATPGASRAPLNTVSAGHTGPAVTSRFSVEAPDGSNINRLSVSPDGRKVAFVAGGKLFVRVLDSTETRTVEGITGVGSPFWSPDGRFLAIVTGGQLKTIRVADGSTKFLSDVNTNLGGSWGADGSILIGKIGDGILRIPVDTGVAEPVTRLDTALGEARHLLPQFLPDGRRFLYLAGTPHGEASLQAGSLDATASSRIMSTHSNVQYVATEHSGGYLVYVREGLLMAQKFDANQLRTLAQPVIIGGPLGTTPALGADLGIAEFSATESVLAYRSPGVPGAGPMDRLKIIKIGTQPAMRAAPAAGVISVVRNWMAELQR